MSTPANGYINAGTLDEIRERGCTVVTGGGHAIAVFSHNGQVFAVDNQGQALRLHRGEEMHQ